MTNTTNIAPPVVDADHLRAFHRKFVTGVTIVTTMDRGAPRGLAVNAFSSVSLDPALILVCVAKTSSTYEPLFRAERFAVNLLAGDQGRRGPALRDQEPRQVPRRALAQG